MQQYQYSFAYSVCPAPFMEHDGSCFYLSTEEVPWETAKTKCESVYGHLVMIKNAEQQEKVMNFLNGYSKIYTLYYDLLF